MKKLKVCVLATVGLAGIAGAMDYAARPVPSAGQLTTSQMIFGAGGADDRHAPQGAQLQAAAVGSFTPSNTDFPNPERGFYRATWTSNLDQMTQADATDAYNNGFRLLFARINLDSYRGTDTLPTAYLNSLRTAFGYARNAGVKLIVRAVYNYPDGEANYQTAPDAPLGRVQTHINQLKPVLQENGDVIAFVQAGFIGAWGEWHTSSNNLHSSALARTAVKDALLDAVPVSRFVQFRYPWHIREWSASLPTLDSAVSSNFRLGFHNDCFLSSVEDVGTYSTDPNTRSGEQDYADRLGNVGPVGGETCNSTWSPTAVRRTTCADILNEGARYNFSYLNIQYWRPEFHDRWVNNGCMPDVQRRMGYRLTLTQASHNNSVNRGATLNLSFSINNSGWARLYNPRLVQVVLQNTSTNAYQRITATGADPRKWVPGANNASVNVVVPGGLAAGTYRVLLALPDASASLTNNARYAVRFANDNNASTNQYWDSNLAAFSLGTTVQVN